MTDEQELIKAQQIDIANLTVMIRSLQADLDIAKSEAIISKQDMPYSLRECYFYIPNFKYMYLIHIGDVENMYPWKGTISVKWRIRAMNYVGQGVTSSYGNRHFQRNIYSAEEAELKITKKIEALEKKGLDASAFYSWLEFVRNNSYGVEHLCLTDEKDYTKKQLKKLG